MNSLFVLGLALIFAGVALLVAMPLLALAEKPAAVGGAAVGCVVVFFVPICFGAGNEPYFTLAAALLMAVAAFLGVLQWLLWKRSRQEQQE